MDIARAGSAFLKSFLAAKQQREQTDQDKRERDARLKLFEIQLEREKQQNQLLGQQTEARTQLMDRLQGAERLPGTGVKLLDPTAKTPSLTELLADPESAMQVLQAGLGNLGDITKAQSAAANQKFMESVMGGGGAPQGMELSGVKVDTSGRPMLDFARREIWQEVPSPDGMSMVQIDRQGRVLGSRPVSPNERPQPTEEDKRQREIKSALDVYEKAKAGLVSGLEGSITGPVLGRLPALTSAQQTAKGGVAAMAPVLKQLFRAAGEGVFTDKDQQLLLDMIPTRETEPKARQAMMENIDAIVRAKLGLGARSGNEIDFSELPD